MHKSSYSFGKVFFALCKQVDTPKSLGCWLRFKYAEFIQLAELRVNPRDYLFAQDFASDYLCVSYISKYKGLDTGLDTKTKALQGFTDSEVKCAEMNRKFRSWRAGSSKGPDAVLFTAARKIRDLIGPFSHFALEKGMGFGPGATNDMRRCEAFLDEKLTRVPLSVSTKARQLAASVISCDLHWSSCILNVNVEDILGPFSFRGEVFNITDYGVFDTVPKNALTDRVILKEPRLNAFLQKGAGAFFRRKLKSVGIDLNSQEFNQEAAWRCFTDELVTLDLKAASDSISRELVFELLPVDWAFALDDLRSSFARMPHGKMVKLEKFSSMGNGFTFELESLIFWAVTKAVCEIQGYESEVLIYGDDIICSSEASAHVVEALETLGFGVNLEKSFVSGNFYESCGRHYFTQVDVTPIYQKEIVEDENSYIRMHNRLRRYDERARLGGLNSATRSAYSQLWRDRPHTVAICTIPLTCEGDDAFVVDYEDLVYKSRCINRGLKVWVLTSRTQSFPSDDRALLAAHLRARDGLAMPTVMELLEDPRTDISIPYEGFLEAPSGKTCVSVDTRWIPHSEMR